jgi:hypothetical protein
MNRIILFAIFALIIIAGCDVVNGPYTHENSEPPPVDTGVIRKVLLEDFTGHLCKHCPEAADLAKSLQDTKYGSRLIIMGIHAGFYAEPDALHPTDFRTPAGNDIDAHFGVTDVGNPNGLVNRTAYSGNMIVEPAKWDNAIEEFTESKPDMKITVTPSYDAFTRQITANVVVKYLNIGTSNQKLAVYILEDSIVDYQLDKRVTPQDVPDYVHNHVLRGAINSTWGDQLSTSEISIGTEITKKYTYTVPANWRPEKLKILAYVHDFNQTWQILQVEEADVITR